jgi:hypothetical protein
MYAFVYESETAQETRRAPVRRFSGAARTHGL